MADVDIILGPSFVKGDTDTLHDYPVTRSRVAVDLTGYSAPLLEAYNLTTDVVVAPITGSVVAPATGGVVRFDHDSVAANEGQYRCQIVLVHPTNGSRRLAMDILIPVRKRVEDMT